MVSASNCVSATSANASMRTPGIIAMLRALTVLPVNVTGALDVAGWYAAHPSEGVTALPAASAAAIGLLGSSKQVGPPAAAHLYGSAVGSSSVHAASTPSSKPNSNTGLLMTRILSQLFSQLFP